MATLLMAVAIASVPFAHSEPLPSPAPTPLPIPGIVAGIDGPPTTTAYSDEVCKPPTVHPSDPLPPCVGIENIETLCYPNGTAPLYLAAHAQCMCRGSYFPEWNACRRCLSVHGQLSDPDLKYFESVATAASTSLCGFLTSGSGNPTTTPTAIFRDLFTSAQARLTPPTAGASSLGSDVAPSNTDIAVYFTASGPGGPGSITGSATAATATGLALATGHPPPLGGVSSSSGSSGTSASSTGSSPSASASGSSTKPSGAEKLPIAHVGLLLTTILGVCLFL